MRRGERAAYLIFGAAFTPFAKVVFANSPSLALHELPIILALTIVAVVSNISVVQRFGAIIDLLRAEGQGAAGRADGARRRWAASRTRPAARESTVLAAVDVGSIAARERASRFWEWIRHHTTAVLSTIVDYSVMVGVRRACVTSARSPRRRSPRSPAR